MSDTASATENQAPALKALADAVCAAHDAYLHPTDPNGYFAEAVMEHLAEAGYVIVPREPTPEMQNAGAGEEHDSLHIWRAMAGAAP